MILTIPSIPSFLSRILYSKRIFNTTTQETDSSWISRGLFTFPKNELKNYIGKINPYEGLSSLLETTLGANKEESANRILTPILGISLSSLAAYLFYPLSTYNLAKGSVFAIHEAALSIFTKPITDFLDLSLLSSNEVSDPTQNQLSDEVSNLIKATALLASRYFLETSIPGGIIIQTTASYILAAVASGVAKKHLTPLFAKINQALIELIPTELRLTPAS